MCSATHCATCWTRVDKAGAMRAVEAGMPTTNPAPTPAALVPVTLLTGFLGSGKTTLVNRLLTEAHGRRLAVLVNEFGELGIDGALVQKSSGPVVELANGCV